MLVYPYMLLFPVPVVTGNLQSFRSGKAFKVYECNCIYMAFNCKTVLSSLKNLKEKCCDMLFVDPVYIWIPHTWNRSVGIEIRNILTTCKQSNDMDIMVIIIYKTKQNQQPDRVECIMGQEISRFFFFQQLPLWGQSSHQAPSHITYLWEERKSCKIKCAMEEECIGSVLQW